MGTISSVGYRDSCYDDLVAVVVEAAPADAEQAGGDVLVADGAFESAFEGAPGAPFGCFQVAKRSGGEMSSASSLAMNRSLRYADPFRTAITTLSLIERPHRFQLLFKYESTCLGFTAQPGQLAPHRKQSVLQRV